MTNAYAGPPSEPDVLRLNGADLDQARSVLNRFFYPMAVSTPEGPDGFQAALRVIQLGPLTVGHLSFGAPVTVVAAEVDGYHVTLPTAGQALARQAGHEVAADPETAAVFRPGQPACVMHDGPSTELDIKIERLALESELEALLGRPVDGPIDLPLAMNLRSGPSRSWSRLISLVRDELDSPRSLIRHPLIAEQLRHSVLSGLLLCLPHRYHDELMTPVRPMPPRAIRRAVDAIHQEPERPFTVADLAAVAGMSVRSLQEGFRRHVGYTPMAYLQRVRLVRAHEALREADPHRVTVASIAHRWGFAHLGRFSSAYRSRFGASPSETLRGSN
jgi:AraC-like DNA-binding protein